MKHESLSATAKHVSSSTSLTKRIELQWCAYALALALVLGLAVVATPPAQAQTFTVLHTFTAPPDGADPGATLIDVNHNLYGITFGGGASRYYGTVFEVSNRGKETVLHSFNKANGENPSGSLIRDSAGDLYGTTYYGGASGNGTVFKLDANGKETLLHSFTGYPTDGGYPEAGLVMDTEGNLYGTTSSGGTSDYGTVFKLDTTSGTEIVLYSFTGGADGGIPAFGTLLMDAKGNLYGTAELGGASNSGVVFKLIP